MRAAHASIVPHPDWQATIDRGVEESKKALQPQPLPAAPVS